MIDNIVAGTEFYTTFSLSDQQRLELLIFDFGFAKQKIKG